MAPPSAVSSVSAPPSPSTSPFFFQVGSPVCVTLPPSQTAPGSTPGKSTECEGILRCFLNISTIPFEPLGPQLDLSHHYSASSPFDFLPSAISTPSTASSSSSPRILFGIELVKPVGTSHGDYDGTRYFHCADKFGIWVDPANVKKITSLAILSKGESSPEKEGGKSENAAFLLQRVFKRWTKGAKAKQDHLFAIWNELDMREESELMRDHRVAMKIKAKLIERKKKAVLEVQRKRAAARASNSTEEKERELYAIPIATASPSLDSSSKPNFSPQRLSSIDPHALTVQLHRASLPSPNSPIPISQLILNPDDLLTLDFATHLLDCVKMGNLIPLETCVEILRRAKAILKHEPNVVRVHFHSRLTVIGDIHGQISDAMAIFKLNGLPSARNSYLFNGDFVDRGQFSCECALILLTFKCLYPNSFHLNRGNHESRDINSRDGFEKECILKYNSFVFDLFSDVFACLPLAHLIENSIFVTHGGLPPNPPSLKEIDQINRFHEIPPTDSLMEYLLWSDPSDDVQGYESSPRGAGVLFGPDITEQFLTKNHLRLIIRSHECFPRGYAFHHDERVISIFSASNYCGVTGNEGSFVIFEPDLIPRIVPFYARPKEKLSRYRLKSAILENEIVSKLLTRISQNRLALTDHFMKIERERLDKAAKNSKANGSQSPSPVNKKPSPHGLHTITRVEWCEGLQKILHLKTVNFLEFQELLGLPKLGVDGIKNGDIDYMEFLMRFKPNNFLLHSADAGASAGEKDKEKAAGKDSQETKEAPAASLASPTENLERIMEVLTKHKWELESLFRHIDSNGDGRLSTHELKDGLMNLRHLLHYEFQHQEIEQLIHYIDSNHDSYLSYEEFFGSFYFKQQIEYGEKQQEKIAAAEALDKEKGAASGSGSPTGANGLKTLNIPPSPNSNLHLNPLKKHQFGATMPLPGSPLNHQSGTGKEIEIQPAVKRNVTLSPKKLK